MSSLPDSSLNLRAGRQARGFVCGRVDKGAELDAGGGVAVGTTSSLLFCAVGGVPLPARVCE